MHTENKSTESTTLQQGPATSTITSMLHILAGFVLMVPMDSLTIKTYFSTLKCLPMCNSYKSIPKFLFSGNGGAVDAGAHS